MATTVNIDTVVHNQLAQTAYLERDQDNLATFNAASNGAILYYNEAIMGDVSKTAFYKIGGEIEDRDVNDTGEADAKKIGMDESVGIKKPYAYGPYEATKESFKRRARNVDEFAEIIGHDAADAMMGGRLSYALASLKAAISGNAEMVAKADLTVDGKASLTKALRPFGDKFDRVALLVMNSGTYFDIVDDATTNQIYGESNIVIYGGLPGTLGKPVLVTDKVDGNDVFALQAGAIRVIESQAPDFELYPIHGRKNMAMGYQGEGTINIEMLGYSWKESSGINPTAAQLADKANWVKHATSNKMTAGVLLTLDKTEKPGSDGGLGG